MKIRLQLLGEVRRKAACSSSPPSQARNSLEILFFWLCPKMLCHYRSLQSVSRQHIAQLAVYSTVVALQFLQLDSLCRNSSAHGSWQKTDLAQHTTACVQLSLSCVGFQPQALSTGSELLHSPEPFRPPPRYPNFPWAQRVGPVPSAAAANPNPCTTFIGAGFSLGCNTISNPALPKKDTPSKNICIN